MRVCRKLLVEYDEEGRNSEGVAGAVTGRTESHADKY